MLDTGRLADVTIVDLSGIHLRPTHDILQTLVYVATAPTQVAHPFGWPTPEIGRGVHIEGLLSQ